MRPGAIAAGAIRQIATTAQGVRGYAAWSPDRRYRWALRRSWDGPAGAPEMVWVMLNPSTAGAGRDDATIRRCVWYARRDGCTAMTAVNLFALVSTSPRGLLADGDPVGELCDQAIIDACTSRDVTSPAPPIVVVAWGAHAGHPRLRGRADAVLDMLDGHHVGYWALGLSTQGQPVHPLRQPRSAQLGVMSTGSPV
jgi:hypothetical protein